MASVSHAIKAIRESRVSRVSRVGCLLALGLITTSCGDVYRPVAQIVPGTPPNPSAVHFVETLSANGKLNTGSGSRLDVAGDTNLGNLQTGVQPAHAALIQNASKLYIANFGDDTVTENAPSSPTVTSTIGLPSGSQPVFVHSAETNNVYVANFGTSTVSVIDTNSNVVTTSVPVGANPVALAEMPSTGSTNQKLYVANEGSSSVSVINVLDDSLGAAVPVGAPQVWAVARSDSARIYVLDSSGTISAINTLTDMVIPTSAAASAGAGANFIFLDSKAQRLYVTNPVAHTLSIFDITESNPLIPVSHLITLDLSQSASPAYIPTSGTGIGDGSRAYVASYQLTTCPALSGSFACVNTAVSVIDVGTNSVSKIIPIASSVPVDTTNTDGCGGIAPPPAMWTPSVGTRFRLSTASSGGGSTSNFKVYVAQCDAQNVAVIDTFPVNSNPADTYAGVTVPAPLSAASGQQVSISGATQTAATSTTPATTSYPYTQTAGSGLQVGMSIFVSGMTDTGNNGNFVITALGTSPATFTVDNPSGVTNSTQSGTGSVLPRQSPVFVVAGP